MMTIFEEAGIFLVASETSLESHRLCCVQVQWQLMKNDLTSQKAPFNVDRCMPSTH